MYSEMSMNRYPFILSASSIIGYKVVGTDGRELGTIKELMIELEDGRVSYAVLSFGGFLGLGNKLFAIPWEEMIINADEQIFILNMASAQLKNASGFDKKNWPDGTEYSYGWLLDLYNYYGYTPDWVSEAEQEGNQSIKV
jgi:sporulation protein YlmC with PRC-barrel domain